MPNSPTPLSVRLFYSYSHADREHKEDMKKTLATLRQHHFLKEWSDAEITPGWSISEEILANLSNSDIIVFLFSNDFLDSDECIKEWNRAKELSDNGRLVFRVPIIIRDCAWQDFLGADDVKALPYDGKAVATYQHPDTAWLEIYEGIKQVVERLRVTHTPKPAFLEAVKDSDLPTTKPISLDSIYVFPHLTKRNYASTVADAIDDKILTIDDLLIQGHAVIHGQEKSGKTGLAKHLYLSMIERHEPVLFVDLGKANARLGEGYLRTLYEEQFNGDYSIWKQKEGKTLLIDNMSIAPEVSKFLSDCRNIFFRIVIFVSSDLFHSFLVDDTRLADFESITIEPLTHTKQEELIRKRLATLDRAEAQSDGFIDQVEDRVNSIIISNRIVPRYPFFVLSILHTYDSYMPNSLSVSSYGHCYHIFIVAALLRADIPESDDAINSCFNFAEELALATFLSERSNPQAHIDFLAFKQQYVEEYIMEEYLLNRLVHNDLGIITEEGQFKSSYMYYYFLGKVLATDLELSGSYVPELCHKIYEEANYLTLLFAIHHAVSDDIVNDILLYSMIELEDLPVATLSPKETSRFADIVSHLPESVLSPDSVEDERARERRKKDDVEEMQDGNADEPDGKTENETSLSMLRILKNNKVMGQVLRNQYGKLQRSQIESIVETVADSSFRLVNSFLKDEDEIHKLAQIIKTQHPDADLREVRQLLQAFSFLWTMNTIEQAVDAVCVASIADAVDAVVERNNTPAYDIFGYFNSLDNAVSLSMKERKKLANLIQEHRDQFVKRVLSIRTQYYMNTHRVNRRVVQSIRSLLGLKEVPPRRAVRD
ncbi:MAG: toll/interleukin-1 receptor domain-containing protein [bacterium]|nr:toll/interleukin-1 receptor domain-containing protein [bacterium]